MASYGSVLLVDDDPATRVALPRMLTIRLPDVAVETYASAVMGLEALRGKKYCVVIAELRMPEMDGLRLLRQVRQVVNVRLS